jgi:ADP-heptose:LPS heptosyltransferase
MFRLTAREQPNISETDFITLQPGSGNNITPWKTLKLEKWIKVIDGISDRYPHLNVVVLGDDTETDLMNRLPIRSNLINAIGKTDLEELPGMIANARLHIGNDSAIMHLAGCLGVPTVSVWGGSDPALYGWAKINPHKHRQVYTQPTCGPCNRWLKPNQTKTEIPSMCPDFQCLTRISPKDILVEIDDLLSID